MRLKEKILGLYDRNPLGFIILVAFVARLFAVLFSKGFGMHDDHFLIIESSKSWILGFDYNDWLPWSQNTDNPVPKGHSLFYPGFMYGFFAFLQFLGIKSLNAQMYLVRLIHALWSLLVVYYGYKITEKYTNRKIANIAGWTLSLFFLMPWLSVRNLVEMVAIPFLMAATWLYVKDETPKWGRVLWVGILLGMAMCVRYQVVFFIGGFGLALLIMKRWRDAVIIAFAVIVSFSVIQCIPDMFLWHRPFAEFWEYVSYNLASATSYFNQPWYNYLLVILGLMLPPISVFIFGGFLYEWRRWILFLPSFSFLFFHSLFPNKQERFIFTIFPFIMFLGIMGIYDYWQRNPNKLKLKKIFRICLYISLTINIIALIPTTVHYSKKARVEAMVYLSNYPESEYYVIEGMLSYGVRMPVETYADHHFKGHGEVDKQHSWAEAMDLINENQVSFVLFEGEEHLDERVAEAKKYIPNLVFDVKCEESFLDALVQAINPINENYPIIIYRNADVIPEKKTK
ncbi:MAG: glycosyltransferase family 39 protein [Bacteroidales bacterium]|nr:glycosyltransferase family 39 protein [Bacteroidales bacterium]